METGTILTSRVMHEFCHVCVSRYAWNLLYNVRNLIKINPAWFKESALKAIVLPKKKLCLKSFKYKLCYEKAASSTRGL